MYEQYVQLHRQALTYLPLLYTPHRIYTALIRYLGLLDSTQLWSKLIKYVSILKIATLSQVIQVMIESYQHGSMDAIDTKWGVMSVLALLVIVWVKLGRHPSSNLDLELRQINITFTVTGGLDKSELNLLIHGSRSLQKEDISKLLHRIILTECQKYEWRLETDQNSKKCYLICLEELSFEGILYPSVLQITETRTKLLIRRQKNYKRNGILNVQQYTSLLKYFRRLPNMKYQTNIYSFLEFFCKTIQEKLSIMSKSSQIYLKIQPKDILILQKNQEILIEIDLPLHSSNNIDPKKLSAQQNSPFSDRRPQMIISKIDYWSSALTLLSLVGRYPYPQYFQQLIANVNNESLTNFITTQIKKVETQRQFDSEQVMKFLMAWNKPEIKKQNTPSQSTKSTVSKESKSSKSGLGLDWLQTALSSSKGGQQKKLTPGFPIIRPDKQINIGSFLGNISLLSKNNVPALNSNTKNYTLYSNSNQNQLTNTKQNQKQIQNKKVILGDKTFDLDINFTDKRNWKDQKSVIKKYQKKYEEVQLLIKEKGIESLSEKQKKYNIISQQETNKQSNSNKFKGNRLFFSAESKKYICISCKASFHGVITCERYKIHEKYFREVSEKQFNDLKIHKKTINRVALKRFFNKLNTNYLTDYQDLEKIYELQALLQSCLIYKEARERYTDHILGDQNSLIIEELVPILKMNLTILSRILSQLGSRSEAQIKDIAQDNRSYCLELLQIYNIKQGYLYLLCLN